MGIHYASNGERLESSFILHFDSMRSAGVARMRSNFPRAHQSDVGKRFPSSYPSPEKRQFCMPGPAGAWCHQLRLRRRVSVTPRSPKPRRANVLGSGT